MYVLTVLYLNTIQEHFLFHLHTNAIKKYIALLKEHNYRFCQEAKILKPDHYIKNPQALAEVMNAYEDYEHLGNFKIHYNKSEPQDLSDLENQRPDYVEAQQKDQR